MHISIKKKILLISISFSLIMGLVVALTSYSIFYHYNKNNLTHDTELNVSHITDTINEDFAPVASLVRWCQINARLLPYQLYKDNSGDSRTLLHERLNDQYNMVTHSNSNNHIQRLVVSNFSDYYIQIVSASYSTTADVPDCYITQSIPSGSSFMQFSSFIYLIGIIVALIVLAGLAIPALNGKMSSATSAEASMSFPAV